MKTTTQSDAPKTEASYPGYDLAEAIKVAEAVRDLGGNNAPVAKSLLAQHLKYAETGPSFVQRVLAARAFGVIDGRGSYSLTEHGKQYFYPTVEKGKEIAAVKMLGFPRSFSILLQKFDGGKLPTIEMIGNIIHAEADIPVSKKSILAGCFIRSAQFIGAIDTNGFLRCKALVAGSARVPDPKSPLTPTPQDPPPPPLKPFDEVPGTKTYELPLDKENKRCVKINAPLDITAKEVQRIANWLPVQLLIDDNLEKP